jgi:ferredoxin
MVSVDRYRCTYCGACVSMCPVEALTLAETRLVLSDECTDCGSVPAGGFSLAVRGARKRLFYGEPLLALEYGGEALCVTR